MSHRCDRQMYAMERCCRPGSSYGALPAQSRDSDRGIAAASSAAGSAGPMALTVAASQNRAIVMAAMASRAGSQSWNGLRHRWRRLRPHAGTWETAH